MARRRSSLSPAEVIVADTMGRLAESWGLKRNLGRCWAVLYVLGRPTTAAEIQRTLGLSSGAVSMALQELQRWGVIRRTYHCEERRKLYVAEVDVWRVVSRIFRARELMDLDGAIDSLERAVEEMRKSREKTKSEAIPVLERRIQRVDGLLDLLRVVSSLFRVLVTTARLDARILTSFRLGGEVEDS